MSTPATTPTRRRGRNALLALLIVGAVALASAAAYSYSPFGRDITVTAQFDSAAGLYEDNVVAVLGMPVGKVRKITPKGEYVEAEFTVDRGVKIPADVNAVTINTSILTARQIELTPPIRADRCCRTAPPSDSTAPGPRWPSTGS